jgi:serine/threonine protein kinase
MARVARHSVTDVVTFPGFTDVVHVARGGTGDILHARETGMGRTVALKVFRTPDGDEQADRELTVAGWLGLHPHLVTVHGRGWTSTGQPFVVMPWYGGGSLADQVRREGLLPVDEALRLAVKLAGALAHLHGHGVVHRDVKPANVLLTTAGEPVLADFGLATLPGEPEAPAAGLTPVHAAPEVLRGEPSTARSDVWSLASTLCTVLDRRDVPSALIRLLAAATSPGPDERPAAAGVLVADLQEIQTHLGVAVTEVPAVPATPPALSVPAAPTVPRIPGVAPPAPRPAAPARSAPVPAVPPADPDPEPAYAERPAADVTVLRDPPPPPRRNPWPAVLGGALAGSALAVAVLSAATVLDLWRLV